MVVFATLGLVLFVGLGKQNPDPAVDKQPTLSNNGPKLRTKPVAVASEVDVQELAPALVKQSETEETPNAGGTVEVVGSYRLAELEAEFDILVNKYNDNLNDFGERSRLEAQFKSLSDEYKKNVLFEIKSMAK